MRIHEILVEDQQLDELSWAGVKQGAGALAGAAVAGAKQLPGLAVKGADLAKRAAVGGYNAAKAGGRALNTVAGDLATGYDNAGKIVQRVAKTTGQTARGIGNLGRAVGDAVSSTAQGAAGAVRSVGDIAGAAGGAITNPIGGIVGGYSRGRDMQQASGAYPGTAAQNTTQQSAAVTQSHQSAAGAGTQVQQQSAVQSLAAQYAKLKNKQKQSFQRQAGLAPAAAPTLSVQQGGGRAATPESAYYSKFLSKEI